jgi:hypothetical protein
MQTNPDASPIDQIMSLARKIIDEGPSCVGKAAQITVWASEIREGRLLGPQPRESNRDSRAARWRCRDRRRNLVHLRQHSGLCGDRQYAGNKEIGAGTLLTTSLLLLVRRPPLGGPLLASGAWSVRPAMLATRLRDAGHSFTHPAGFIRQGGYEDGAHSLLTFGMGALRARQ